MQKSIRVLIFVSIFAFLCTACGASQQSNKQGWDVHLPGIAITFTVPSSTATSNTPKPQPTSTPANNLDGHNHDFISRAITRTNLYRQQNGCPALSENTLLDQAALNHSKDMAVRNYFDHSSPDGQTPWDRMHAVGYQFSSAAENIAAGFGTPEEVIDAFFNETPPNDGHRKNILNCSLKEVGIGYYYLSSSTYKSYWTQDFGTPL
jgi:uncharacterized protein YkwD